jgi:photosystem II stability/assembly factor-like uncharacterized protein
MGLALLASLASGCTFYTACPDQQPPPNTGGTGNTGGSSTGGTGGSGPPLIPWVNVTSNLSGMDSSCGNLTMVVAKQDTLIVGVAPRSLWKSTDGGGSWEEIAQGKGTDPIDGTPAAITLDPEHPDTWWLTAIYGDHGIWRTDDNGDTFKMFMGPRHNDVVSVDFTDPDRKFMVAGGHESAQVVWRSFDSGESWEQVGDDFPSGAKDSSYPHVIDSERVLMGTAGISKGDSGIFRSVDTADNWDRVTDGEGGLGQPLVTSTGVYYWASESGSVMKSEDEGESWEEVLPANSVSGIRSLAELPDGRLATLTQYEGIKISDDGFETRTQLTEPTPFYTLGFTYSAHEKAFFVWHNDCGDKVLEDAVMRADFDYEAATD